MECDFSKKEVSYLIETTNMGDILKSVLFGMVLVVTLSIAAPILNNDKTEVVVVPEDLELQTEKDIHIP